MTMVSPVSILSAVLDKIENFNFRWSEVPGSCQDGVAVTDSRWSFIEPVKICVGAGIRSSMGGYVQIMTSSKCWSITGVGVNCERSVFIFQWSLKVRDIFFVSEWEHEGSRSFPVARTWCNERNHHIINSKVYFVNGIQCSCVNNPAYDMKIKHRLYEVFGSIMLPIIHEWGA